VSAVRLLSDHLINRIAAGEVVERPASVLKELLENSLDAGADRIEVDADAGGRRLIKVADNGSGMTRDDLLLAVERHATSKLAEETDLLQIHTLGFRGEALPSVGAVSRMIITTASTDDGAGTRARISGGKLLDVADAARDRGTTVEAADLFFNVPARRKFLKSINTEAAHLLETVQRYALAQNGLRLVYRHNGLELLSTSPREDDLTRLGRVLGRQTAKAMFSFEGQSGDIRLSGFLGRPETEKSRASHLHLFVNQRPVKDRLLTRAVLQAYRGRLGDGRYPAAVVYLTIDPELVDVNVHPAKAEVRFRHPNQVYDWATTILAQTLGESLRPLAPKPAQVYQMSNYGQGATGVREARAETMDWTRVEPREAPSFGQSEFIRPEPALAEEALAVEDAQDIGQSGLRPIGQLFRSYILAQGPDGLFVIDQHAAHERILFEQLKKGLADGQLPGQGLLTPETLELTPTQAMAVEKMQPALTRFGFDLSPFGGDTYVIRSVPSVLAGHDGAKVILDIIEQAAEETGAGKEGLERVEDELLSSLACHGAVKASRYMTLPEMDRLLQDLLNCEVPTNCPHGRPLIFSMSRRDIEKRFHRT
jgi:DNA mismatch repair protein MutL